MDSTTNIENVLSKKLESVESNVLKNLERIEQSWANEKDSIKDILLKSQKNNNSTNNNNNKKKVILSTSINQHRKLDNFERTLKGFVNEMENSLRDIVSPDWQSNRGGVNNDDDQYDYLDSRDFNNRNKKSSPRADNGGYKLIPSNTMTIRSNTPNTPNRGRGRAYGRSSSNTPSRNISPTKNNPFFVDDYNGLDISTMNDYATRIELENLESKVIDSFREMVRAQEQQTIQLNTVAEVVLSVQEKCEALEIAQERPRSAISRLEAKANNKISNVDIAMDAKSSDLTEIMEVFDKKIHNINNYMQKRFEKVDDESSGISGQVLENKKSLDNWKNKFSLIDRVHDDFRDSLDKMKSSISNNAKTIDIISNNINANSSNIKTNENSISELRSRVDKFDESYQINNNNTISSKVTYNVDDKVEVNWQGKGNWYSCKITSRRDDGTYDVVYDVDNSAEVGVSSNLIRPIDPQLGINATIFARISDVENRIASVSYNNANDNATIDSARIDDIMSRLSKLEETSNSKTSASIKSSESTTAAINDIITRLNRLEENQNTINSNTKGLAEVAKKVNKMEENINRAMSDVFKKIGELEKNITTNSNALQALDGKMMKISDSSKLQNKNINTVDNSSNANNTNTNTNTNTNITNTNTTNNNDEWEVSSVKTESGPQDILQSSIDALKQQISQEEANIMRLNEEKTSLKQSIKNWISDFKKANGREPTEDDKVKEKTMFESYQEKAFMKEDAELYMKELVDKLRLKNAEMDNMKNTELYSIPIAESLEFKNIKDNSSINAKNSNTNTNESTAEEGSASIRRLSKSDSSSSKKERRASSREGGAREGDSSSSKRERRASSREGDSTTPGEGASSGSVREKRSSKREKRGQDDPGLLGTTPAPTSTTATAETSSSSSSSSRKDSVSSKKSSSYVSSFNGDATTSLIDYTRHEKERKKTAQYKLELESSTKLKDPKFEEEKLRNQIKAAESDLVTINEERSIRKNMIRDWMVEFKAKNGHEPTAAEKQEEASEMFMLYNEIIKRKDETEARITKLMARLTNLLSSVNNATASP